MAWHTFNRANGDEEFHPSRFLVAIETHVHLHLLMSSKLFLLTNIKCLTITTYYQRIILQQSYTIDVSCIVWQLRLWYPDATVRWTRRQWCYMKWRQSNTNIILSHGILIKITHLSEVTSFSLSKTKHQNTVVALEQKIRKCTKICPYKSMSNPMNSHQPPIFVLLPCNRAENSSNPFSNNDNFREGRLGLVLGLV